MQKTRFPKVVLLVFASLTSCVKFPNAYAPDRARQADSGPDPRGLKAFVEMKEAASLAHIAWGVNLAAFDGEKRKIESKAAFRFAVPAEEGWHLSVDFVSPGNQDLVFLVNGRKLGSSANGHFETPIPAALLVANTATLLVMESPEGVSLLRAGFLKK